MIGFSLSPGGLLLPYHVGVLAALESNGHLNEHIPIAGSSAGAIAVVAHSCGIPPERVLESTIQISETCKKRGGARGRLLGPLQEVLDEFIDESAFEKFQQRQGATGVAYKQIFPKNLPILQTEFETREDLIRSVLHSSTFPFFTLNWPCAVDMSRGLLPRLMVDGYFTVPRNRFGCPDFELTNFQVDRTVTISVFPHDTIGIDVSDPEDQISPLIDGDDEMTGKLLKLATESSSAKALTKVYESGWIDAERWCQQEDERQRKKNDIAV